MSQNFNWSPEWQAKLTRITELAENAREGDEFFLEMSRSNPMCSMYLRTGGVSLDNPNKKNVHLLVEQEPVTYPYWPSTREVAKDNAYVEYLGRFKKEFGNTNSSRVPMSKSTFKDKYTEITKVVDSEIKESHGIMCYHDGNVNNTTIHNCYILHICDVLNIHIRKKKGLKTRVLIRSYILNQIGPDTTSKLIEETLTSDQLAFLEENIDYFYRQYCYYGNYSYVPVRTYVERDCSVFKLSKFFMNDTFYTKHQKGKLKEFNQMNGSLERRILYRSL
jgi:hypothetical protein